MSEAQETAEARAQKAEGLLDRVHTEVKRQLSDDLRYEIEEFMGYREAEERWLQAQR